jgi:hypothetical protein
MADPQPAHVGEFQTANHPGCISQGIAANISIIRSIWSFARANPVKYDDNDPFDIYNSLLKFTS